MNKETIKCNDDNIKQIVKEQVELSGNEANLNHLDVSNVTNMDWMFQGSLFNGDISGWDVSKVTSMDWMFQGSLFNGDISGWDVSKVTNMQDMFEHSKFNGDISKWDVSNVTYMGGMFFNSNFNGDISKWDVSNVKFMGGMFYDSPFNGDISKWDVNSQEWNEGTLSTIVSQEIMRLGNEADLNHLDVSNVTYMGGMFFNSNFNGDISKWDVSNVENMTQMFDGSNFNGDISKWDVSKVFVKKDMFKNSSIAKENKPYLMKSLKISEMILLLGGLFIGILLVISLVKFLDLSLAQVVAGGLGIWFMSYTSSKRFF